MWYRWRRYRWSRELDKFGNCYVRVWWRDSYVQTHSRKGFADVRSIVEDYHGCRISANLIDSYIKE